MITDQLDEPTLALWRTAAEATYPKVRGSFVPAPVYDEAMRLRNEYRATKK